MSIDYEQKYIKYKQKYLISKNGGAIDFKKFVKDTQSNISTKILNMKLTNILNKIFKNEIVQHKLGYIEILP